MRAREPLKALGQDRKEGESANGMGERVGGRDREGNNNGAKN